MKDSYPDWLAQRIVDLRRQRRLLQGSRYNASDKGQARNERYEATPKARARKLLYEHTIRAAMRAPSPCRDAIPLRPNPFGNAFGNDRGRVVTHVMFSDPFEAAQYSNWMGGDVPSRFPPEPFDIRAAYADQIRRERQRGLMSPLTLRELSGGGLR